jgi:hypothetical protein
LPSVVDRKRAEVKQRGGLFIHPVIYGWVEVVEICLTLDPWSNLSGNLQEAKEERKGLGNCHGQIMVPGLNSGAD